MNRKLLSALLGCLLGFFSNARGEGFIIIEPPVPEGHTPFLPIEVKSHNLDVKIENQVAVTAIDQTFFNPNNQRVEGTYMFPVPKGAHIDKFSMEIGGKMVEAELLPADKARKIYEDIVRKMRDPALLEYAGRDVFKVRIYPMEPRCMTLVKISYTELLRSDSGLVTYTYPLSMDKCSAWPGSFGLKVKLKTDKPLASIYSPSHKVEIKRDGANRAVIGFESKDVKLDTDFHLVYSTETRGVGLSSMSCKTEGEQGYFLLLAAPTVDVKGAKPAPKDVAFVIDTSGSMAGAKLRQAKKALAFCVESLNEGDRFEIVRFSTEAEALFGKLADVNDNRRRRASEFIDDFKAAGGTAIAEALQTALKARPEKNDRPFVVIFLTDGLPTVGTRNISEIVDRVKKSGANNVRVFSFGIGSDVNTQLLDQIAESTRAFSQYVLADEDIEVKVSNFFTRINEPALTNLRLEFSGDVRPCKMHPAELPDLFKGDQLVVTGRYDRSGEADVKLTGMAAGREQTFDYKVRFEEGNAKDSFVPRLWATRRVGFLLDEIRMHGETKELRDEAAELARLYGIVTPYTAYLIVEDEDRRNVPTAQRSMQEMSRDARKRAGGAQAWAGFKQDKEGAGAVANARSQNYLKQADQPANAIAAGVSASSMGVTPGFMGASSGGGFASRAGEERIAQYSPQTKFVNGRAFFQNGDQWMDSGAQKLVKRQRVQFNSDEYFALLKKHPEAAPWFALGRNLQLALDDTVYEIFE